MKFTKIRKHLSLYFGLGLCAIIVAALANSPAPTQAALKSPQPFYDGALEITDCTQIKGWAWDSERPFEPIYVDLYDGPNLLTTVLANRYRQDLFDTQKGDGRHGFLILTPNALKDGALHNLSAKFGGTSIELEYSPRPVACDASLFPTATPATTASGQGQTWEQGVEFSSSKSGVIKKVRFWRADGEPKGGHAAKLWSPSGQLLKTVPFSETPGSGWQYATFDYSISANVKYKVTYNINYVVAKTFNVFQSGPIISGPLTAWGSSYGTPAGTYPTTGSTSNLFADIIFNTPR